MIMDETIRRGKLRVGKVFRKFFKEVSVVLVDSDSSSVETKLLISKLS